MKVSRQNPRRVAGTEGPHVSRSLPVWLVLPVLLGVLLLAGCLSVAPGAGEAAPVPRGEGEEWKTFPLKDVRTGEVISVDAFAGKTVVIHTFTVACPICTLQQREISAVKGALGDGIVVVGLDIDPAEEPAVLADHARRNGFHGYYAIAPPRVTRSLVDRFGPAVVAPATAPVILVCPSGEATILENGIKSAARLSDAIRTVC